MKTIFLISIFILSGIRSYSQSEKLIIDSLNIVLQKHVYYKGFETRVNLNKNRFERINPPSNQITSVSIFDVESIKCLTQAHGYSVIIYCTEHKYLVTDNNNGKISKSNQVGIVLDSEYACSEFIRYFYQLLIIKGVKVSNENQAFKSDSLNSVFRVKCKEQLEFYCRYGIDSIITGQLSITFANGQKRLDYNLDSGYFDGVQKAWYENGNILEISNYIKGVQHENQVVYHENGQMLSRSNYVNGLQNGLYEEWNDSGIKTLEELFFMGILVSTKTWSNEGELLDFITY